jgi:hypothetical protein
VKFLPLFLIVFLVLPANLWAKETIRTLLLENEIEFKQTVSTGPLIVVFDGGIKNPSNLKSKILVNLVVRRAREAGGVAVVHEGDFRLHFLKHQLIRSELTAPKFVIQISELPIGGEISLVCNLSLINYAPTTKTSLAFRAVETWTTEQTFNLNPSEDQTRPIAEFIELQIEKMLRDRPQAFANPLSNEAPSNKVYSYQLSWRDPDYTRNHFFAGFSIGTPATLNLNIGYWGPEHLPFVVGASGMAWADDRRGFQFDLGWAFDNSGDFRQILGVEFSLINQTTTSTTNQINSSGAVISTTDLTVNELVPYLGA